MEMAVWSTVPPNWPLLTMPGMQGGHDEDGDDHEEPEERGDAIEGSVRIVNRELDGVVGLVAGHVRVGSSAANVVDIILCFGFVLWPASDWPGVRAAGGCRTMRGHGLTGRAHTKETLNDGQRRASAGVGDRG